MKYENFQFVIVSSDSDLDLYNTRAYSIEEAMPEAFIRAHNLFTKSGKKWKIVSAKNLTHFDDVKKL